YWGAIRSRRDTIRALTRRGIDSFATNQPTADGSDAAAEGHPLLASLGRVGRDFQHVLESLADYQDDPRDRYVDPVRQDGEPGLEAEATALGVVTGQHTMLAVLQSDILALRWRNPGGDAEPMPLQRGDDSIAVHACHGPAREAEVLHDQ